MAGASTDKNCSTEMMMYNSSLGFTLTVPEWEAAIVTVVLTLITLFVLVGNILVILSVFTYKPLRTVQNFFLVSLAVADLTVAILVLPFSIVDQMLGRWKFGIHLCKVWLTFDVLCCTASILNLCAIALDRYWAITDPLNYAQKRTLKRVLIMIGGVWILSAIICSPPLFGWNDWPVEFNERTACMLTREQGFTVYSSLGSFYIPLFIMTVVYVEIFIATRNRLRQRARASNLSLVKRNRPQNVQREQDSASSESNQIENCNARGETPNSTGKNKSKMKRKKNDLRGSFIKKYFRKNSVAEDSFTDTIENSSEPQCAISLNKSCIGRSRQSNASAELASPSSRNSSEKRRGSKTIDLGPLSPAKKETPITQIFDAKQRISLSKERRAARTLGIIMGVFVGCWLPFFLLYVIEPFCVSCCPSNELRHFITWLGYINSALNPVIYTIFNMDFRKAFKKLLHIK